MLSTRNDRVAAIRTLAKGLGYLLSLDEDQFGHDVKKGHLDGGRLSCEMDEKSQIFIASDVRLEQFRKNLNHFALPEIIDFNGLSDTLCIMFSEKCFS